MKMQPRPRPLIRALPTCLLVTQSYPALWLSWTLAFSRLLSHEILNKNTGVSCHASSRGPPKPWISHLLSVCIWQAGSLPPSTDRPLTFQVQPAEAKVHYDVWFQLEGLTNKRQSWNPWRGPGFWFIEFLLVYTCQAFQQSLTVSPRWNPFGAASAAHPSRDSL